MGINKTNDQQRIEEEKQIAREFIHQRIQSHSYNDIPEHIIRSRTIPIPPALCAQTLPKIEIQETVSLPNQTAISNSGLKMKVFPFEIIGR